MCLFGKNIPTESILLSKLFVVESFSKFLPVEIFLVHLTMIFYWDFMYSIHINKYFCNSFQNVKKDSLFFNGKLFSQIYFHTEDKKIGRNNKLRRIHIL